MRKGIIIGGGIGGLSTAIALLKKGIQVDVYEQSAEIKEVGAGVWVAPNGLKVFSRLGIADEIMKAGRPLNKINAVDLNYKPISVIDGDKIAAKHGFKTVA